MNFTEQKEKNIYFYTIPAFTAAGGVLAVQTAREGGVSCAPYARLNMALHVGDQREAVLQNRKKFFSELAVDYKTIVCAQQVHGDGIRIVGKQCQGRGADDYCDALPETDALITNVPGVPLVLFFADCVPVFLFDPVKRVIALCHAGWKGTVLKITKKAVRLMQNQFGCKPEHCIAAIGISIGYCHYRVGEDVIKCFSEQLFDLNEIFSADNIACGQSDKGASLDLWAANRLVLMEAGILRSNITIAGMCTCCNNDRFFSYRAENGNTGRMASVLMLK